MSCAFRLSDLRQGVADLLEQLTEHSNRLCLSVLEPGKLGKAPS
jgi:hypothetical protein